MVKSFGFIICPFHDGLGGRNLNELMIRKV